MVWIGTTRQLDAVSPHIPDPSAGYACVEPVALDAPVHAKFTSPHVAYVGAHEGCGCGYQSEYIAFQGATTVAEAQALSAALLDDERIEFEAEQRSRERLRALVETERAWGAVELFACQAGEELAPAIETREVDSAWLTEQLEPFAERVKYVIAPKE